MLGGRAVPEERGVAGLGDTRGGRGSVDARKDVRGEGRVGATATATAPVGGAAAGCTAGRGAALRGAGCLEACSDETRVGGKDEAICSNGRLTSGVEEAGVRTTAGLTADGRAGEDCRGVSRGEGGRERQAAEREGDFDRMNGQGSRSEVGMLWEKEESVVKVKEIECEESAGRSLGGREEGILRAVGGKADGSDRLPVQSIEERGERQVLYSGMGSKIRPGGKIPMWEVLSAARQPDGCFERKAGGLGGEGGGMESEGGGEGEEGGPRQREASAGADKLKTTGAWGWSVWSNVRERGDGRRLGTGGEGGEGTSPGGSADGRGWRERWSEGDACAERDEREGVESARKGEGTRSARRKESGGGGEGPGAEVGSDRYRSLLPSIQVTLLVAVMVGAFKAPY